MPAIDKLVISGFKAFPNEFQLEFNGRNLLLYGENGSGKSSIYYALHCIFQSPLKKDAGKKYFNERNEDGSANPQHLKNINSLSDSAKIRISFTENHPFLYEVNKDGYNTTLVDGTHPLPADITGVFVNHKFLFEFFNFRNSEKINLFTVFAKDIFPFVKDEHSGLHLGEMYDQLTTSVSKHGRRLTKTAQNNILAFNQLVRDLVEEINTHASDVYNKHFKNDEESNLEIKLRYDSNEDKPANDPNEYWLKYDYGIEYAVENGVLVEKRAPYKRYNNPFIGMEIAEMLNDGSKRTINKPQTFFNEAKLTAIALAIRFALLNFDKPADGRFLALDDMLISLDMSNRTKVVNFLMSISDKYKIYLFTHDRLLYSTFKKKIELDKKRGEWLIGGLYMHDIDEENNYQPCIPYPKFIENKDMPFSMMEYYTMHDYPACGQKLRKWCEEILEKLYPDTLKKGIDSRTHQTSTLNLNDRIANLSRYCEKEGLDFQKYKNLKIYKDNILNTVSHYDIESPIYKEEILQIMKVLNKLDDIVKNRVIVPVNHDIGLELVKPDGTPVTVCINIRGNKELPILLIEGNYHISYFINCSVKKIIEAGIHNDFPEEKVYNSIYDIYNEYCALYGIPNTDNLLDILQDHNTRLRDKLTAQLGV